MSFRGNYRHSLNPQGRVSLPARFRQVLVERYSPKLVLVGQPEVVEVWPEEEYRQMEDALRGLKQKRKIGVQDYIFMQRATLFEVEIDSQGRILLPPQLREKMKLNNEVIFVGMPEKINMYSPESYAVIEERANKNYDDNIQLVEDSQVLDPEK